MSVPQFEIQLSDIFNIKNDQIIYSISELANFDLTPSFNETMLNKLSLSFLKTEHHSGNVCFENDDLLRPEYKKHYTKQNILDMIVSSVPDPSKISTIEKITFPESVNRFWELVHHTSE